MKQDHFSTRGYMVASKEGKPAEAPGPYPMAVIHWLETMDNGTGLYDQGFVQGVLVCFPSRHCSSLAVSDPTLFSTP